MKANFDFYDEMTDNEKQICDLCKDWNLGKCERCEITSRYLANKTKDRRK